MVGFFITLKGGANGLASMTWESEISSGALYLASYFTLLLEGTSESQPLKDRLSRIELARDFVNAWFLLDKRGHSESLSGPILCIGPGNPMLQPGGAR
jgi:hypothetical protein